MGLKASVGEQRAISAWGRASGRRGHQQGVQTHPTPVETQLSHLVRPSPFDVPKRVTILLASPCQVVCHGRAAESKDEQQLSVYFYSNFD